MCKSVSPDAVYQAGARGWLWIKLKRDYRTELSDTVDLVVVGAFAGRGRRTGVYGALLLAAYDADEADVFRTVTKCGTGFSDAELAALPARLAPLARPDRPARVDARQQPDVWFEPGLVLEILSAELTLSPTYTAGWGQIKEDAGLAMRFPRFTGRWRDDKSARGRHHHPANWSTSTAPHSENRPRNEQARRPWTRGTISLTGSIRPPGRTCWPAPWGNSRQLSARCSTFASGRRSVSHGRPRCSRLS